MLHAQRYVSLALCVQKTHFVLLEMEMMRLVFNVDSRCELHKELNNEHNDSL